MIKEMFYEYKIDFTNKYLKILFKKLKEKNIYHKKHKKLYKT